MQKVHSVVSLYFILKHCFVFCIYTFHPLWLIWCMFWRRGPNPLVWILDPIILLYKQGELLNIFAPQFLFLCSWDKNSNTYSTSCLDCCQQIASSISLLQGGVQLERVPYSIPLPQGIRHPMADQHRGIKSWGSVTSSQTVLTVMLVSELPIWLAKGPLGITSQLDSSLCPT